MAMPDRSHQIEDLYHAALGRPANQRQAFLLEATAGDDVLRHEVESLLAQEARTESFVEPPEAHDAAQEFPNEQTQSADSPLSQISDPIVGTMVSHYRVMQRVGAGGMGVVYRAHDERLERDVALKVLPPSRLASDAARKRFRKEALALAKLNHPHIGTIYDFDQDEGIDFLVMEYVPGNTLGHQLVSGPMSETEVLSLGIQIVAALAEAHDKGIVHRDLKPGNIAVTPERQVKVLDFGLAKLLRPGNEISTVDELSSTQLGAGTLPYMAPEQLRGTPADARADIYAAGTVFYEMATGQRPFRAKFSTALAYDIQTQRPRPPRQLNPKISLHLEQIILKCLEKKPENRYRSAKELLVDLQRLGGPRTELDKISLILRRFRSRPLLASSVIVVLLAGVYPVWKHFSLRLKPPVGKITLAVLPFENLSRDPQEEYFCDGLTDEMINRLGRLTPQRLGVIARTSAMRYKNTHKAVDEIGRELGVSYILETGVRRDNGRVRISTQLIQVRDQTSLWTESYEYDLAGVFALQSDVAERIAHSLALQLLPQQAAPSQATNPEAYDAYLRGLYHWHKGSAEERRKAREYFEQSVQADPNFAPGYANLASYYSAASDLRPNVAIPKAKEYALKALALDDSLTQAHTALGGIRFYGEWDWPGAGSEFKRALQLNPNDAEAHRTYSNYLLALGRFDEALIEVQRALELDPLSLLLTSVNEGWTFYFARQYDRAIEQCRKALELDANSDGAHACLGWSYLAKGMHEEAITESERAVSLSGRNPARLVGLARAYAADGKKDAAMEVLAELVERAKHAYVSPYSLARIHIALSEKDQALADLDQAYAERDPFLVWLKVDDAFDPLRGNLRFQDLLRRVGFPS
jgi:serine/threonine protein kinase/tetratricopeptide (TPR) repeat protein